MFVVMGSRGRQPQQQHGGRNMAAATADAANTRKTCRKISQLRLRGGQGGCGCGRAGAGAEKGATCFGLRTWLG